MNPSHLGDGLHRAVKMALDSGEAASLAEAERLFLSYQMMIDVGPEVATSPSLQAALLTAVNTGRRSCLGGVRITGSMDTELLIPWRRCRTLGQAVTDLQGTIVDSVVPEVPRLVIGSSGETQSIGEFAVRATFNGWTGGVIPLADGQHLAERQECTLAGVLAGALAVSELFQFLRGNPMAGRRATGLSLWRLEEEGSWIESEPGPPLDLLPAQLWLIGLGHLGQAYLWTLGMLPYAHPDDVRLVLQDFDTLVLANDSTSLLTTKKILGAKKTRAMAWWCEERGFRTVIQERHFRNNFSLESDEPFVALCGVDNGAARSVLEDVGFRWILEAGLGRGINEYLSFRTHTFPARRSARSLWGGAGKITNEESPIHQPAYQALAATGVEQCGLTMLADRTVGASFVGATVATIVVAELLRMMMGEHYYEVINGSLRSLDHRQIMVNSAQIEPFNPGYTQAIATTKQKIPPLSIRPED